MMKKLALCGAFSDAKNKIEREIYYFSGKASPPPPFQFSKAKDITCATTNALEDAYFNIGRVLYDPNFFEFSTKDSNQKNQKHNIISKAGTAFQNIINNKLSAKTAAGDFGPNPKTKVLLRLGEESLLFLGKGAAQVLPRIGTSHAFLYAACIGGALTCLADDATRTMLMDQINHLTSTFSGNDSGNENEPAEDFMPAKTAEIPTQGHKPTYYI